MKLSKNILCVILSVLLLCTAFSFLLPSASAEEYEDGTYTADVSMLGEGWHNAIVSPTTVYIEDGCIYVDVVFMRTTSPWHAPVYVSLTTSYGTYYDPVINEGNYTCSFYHVRVGALGTIDFSAVTEAMSMPYSVDYSVYIDPDAVPLKADGPAVPAGDPEPADDPEPSEDPAPSEDPEPSEDPAPAEDPEPAGEKDPGPDETAEPGNDAPAEPEGSGDPKEEEKSPDKGSSEDPADEAEPVPTTGPEESGAEKSAPKLGTGAVIGIVCAAAVIIAAAVLLSRKKK